MTVLQELPDNFYLIHGDLTYDSSVKDLVFLHADTQTISCCRRISCDVCDYESTCSLDAYEAYALLMNGPFSYLKDTHPEYFI